MRFENTTCSRCGGSGNYSYCQSYGTKCFKCHGSGKMHTKRGAAAWQYYLDSLKVRLDSLQVGDLLHIDDSIMGRRYFAPVTEIKVIRQTGASLKDGVMVPYDIPGLCVTTTHSKYGKSGWQSSGDYMVRKGWDGAYKDAKLVEALAYQDTLTQTGSVRKTKKVAA